MGACVSKKETAVMHQRRQRKPSWHIETNEKKPYNIKIRFVDSIEEEWHGADHVDAQHLPPGNKDIPVDIDHGSAPRVPAGKANVNKNAHHQRRRSAPNIPTSNIPSPGSPKNANLERVNTTELSATEEHLLWQEFCKYQAMFAKCDKVSDSSTGLKLNSMCARFLRPWTQTVTVFSPGRK